MGVLAISLAVAVFPLLSRYASRGDMDNLRSSLNRALRLTLMEGLAAGVGLFILAEPISRLIWVRDRFTPADAQASAFILQMYTLGMWAYCSRQILLRAFYAMKDTRTPLIMALGGMVLNLALVLTLIWMPGIRGGAFGLATAVAASAEAVCLAVYLRRRVGAYIGRSLVASVARSVACSAIMGVAVWAVARITEPYGVGAVVAAGVVTGGVVFLLAAKLLRAPEPAELLRAIRHRKGGTNE